MVKLGKMIYPEHFDYIKYLNPYYLSRDDMYLAHNEMHHYYCAQIQFPETLQVSNPDITMSNPDNTMSTEENYAMDVEMEETIEFNNSLKRKGDNIENTVWKKLRTN